MERIAGGDLGDRHHIADLGEELVPTLVREHLARRPAFEWPSAGDGILERVVRVGVTAGGGEIGMIGQTLRWPLAQRGREGGVAVGVAGHRNGRLQRQPWQAGGELLGIEQRTARRAGRDRREGAGRERAQAVFQGERTEAREDSPLVQVTTGDLAGRERLDDLRSVVPRLLRLPLSDARCLGGNIHVLLSLAVRNRSGLTRRVSPRVDHAQSFRFSPLRWWVCPTGCPPHFLQPTGAPVPPPVANSRPPLTSQTIGGLKELVGETLFVLPPSNVPQPSIAICRG